MSHHDIAVTNLLCAEGLPGAEDLDVDGCLLILTDWSRRVAWETDRHLYKYRRRPSEYENSEAYFRMLTLVTILQRDIGVRYNPAAIGDWGFADSRDSFLHGLVTGRRMGTCSSMPVLYVAVARRLGYPVHLAMANGHVFARWQSEDERFNIEGTNRGMEVISDDEYKVWPRPLTPDQLRTGQYLRPLSAAEEVALFLGNRGHCLEDNGRLAEAHDALSHAVQLAPSSSYYRYHLNQIALRIAAGQRTTIESFQTGWLMPPQIHVSVPPIFHLQGKGE